MSQVKAKSSGDYFLLDLKTNYTYCALKEILSTYSQNVTVPILPIFLIIVPCISPVKKKEMKMGERRKVAKVERRREGGIENEILLGHVDRSKERPNERTKNGPSNREQPSPVCTTYLVPSLLAIPLGTHGFYYGPTIPVVLGSTNN